MLEELISWRIALIKALHRRRATWRYDAELVAIAMVNGLDHDPANIRAPFTRQGELRVQTDDLDNLEPGVQGLPGTIYISESSGAQHFEYPRNDWGMWTWLEPGDYRICWGPVAGYLPPYCRDVSLSSGSMADPSGEVGGCIRE